MSHGPEAGGFGFASPQYYYGETEGYIADYSESECDNQHILQETPDITEIYRRKSALNPQNSNINPVDNRYFQNTYIPEYYYDQVSHPHRRQQTLPPLVEPYVPVYNTRPAQFFQRPISEGNFESTAFRSSPHIGSHPARVYPNRVSSADIEKHQQPKRYPVTVRTPRFYRRPSGNTTLYKRPSALCLPVACQPDPAVCRRIRHLKAVEVPAYRPQEVAVGPEMEMGPNLNVRCLTTRKMDSEGDVNVNPATTNLEELLSQYEARVENNYDDNRNDESVRRNISYISQYLKPRIPSTIRAKMKRKQMSQADLKESSSNDDHTLRKQVPEITPDSLDKLLNQLKKCEFATSIEKINEKVEEMQQNDENLDNEDKSDAVGDESKNNGTPDVQTSKSYNYKDITDQIMRAKADGISAKTEEHEEQMTGGGDPAATTTILPPVARHHHQDERDKQQETPTLHQEIAKRPDTSVRPHSSTRILKHPPLDDHCAIELHRSKSYIVNLIDKALSKELGTVPCQKYSRKEFDNMNPKRAIDLMNRHICGKVDKDLCLEITSALADTIISNVAEPTRGCCSSSNSSRACFCYGEEPTYITQLKQLKWGHIQHIQREVKRLEELERFLDSYQSKPSSNSKL